MGYYIKYGNRFFKRTRNRRIEGIDAILGTKKMAKVYKSLRDAKKAVTTQSHQYKELDGKLEIIEVKIKKVPLLES